MKARICFLIGLISVHATAAMVVHVRHAADPIFSTIVPGSVASVFIESRSTPPGPVVLNPSTTTVTIAGAAASVIGSDNQGGVLVLVPSDTPLSTVDVTVTYQIEGFKLTGSTAVNCIHSLFGLFTLGFGYGPALARQTSDTQTNNFLHPAHSGDFVTLWGTGMGDATPDQVRVLLGGHSAPVSYAGPAPGLTGIDQVNFQIPDDPAIPDGCFVALEVEVEGSKSNLSHISKASTPGPCASGALLSMDQMAVLDAGGTTQDVSFFIDSLVSPQSDGSFVRKESFGASNNTVNERILGNYPPFPLFADDVFYSCGRRELVAPYTDADFFDPGGEAEIGPKIVLTGPSTSSSVTSPGIWLYQLILPPSAPAASPDLVASSYFAPGTWQVAGGGNPVIEPYQSQINVPPAIQVTNFASLKSIDASNDLLVQWNPDGYNPGDVVTLSVTIASLAPTAVCHAHASDGQISVPADLIQIPTATSASFLISVQGSAARFPISLKDGTTLPGSFAFRFSESFTAKIQSQ